MTFLEKQTDPTTPMHWRGNMQADYFYSNGVAGDKFFKHILKKDTLLASECPKCGTVFLPPRLYCEQCFDRLEDDYGPVPKSVTVYSFTLCMEDRSGAPLAEPQLIALIQLDGTDSLLVHKLGEVPPEEVFIGMPVEMVVEPKSKRKGSILDIRYFRPIPG